VFHILIFAVVLLGSLEEQVKSLPSPTQHVKSDVCFVENQKGVIRENTQPVITDLNQELHLGISLYSFGLVLKV
jgi:hypothetical protein